MRLKGFCLFLLSIFSAYASSAQIKGELTQSRILILLDESSSMIQTWGSGKPKYKAADELILRLMDSIYAVNNQVEFSLRVFGHQHTVEENNCYDTKSEVAFSKDNRVQMSFRLADIKPLGVTPIAYSLQQAADHDLVDEKHNAYSIILITDGGESCGGDICDVMKKLLASKVYFKPYIVSLEDFPALKSTYACMGDYLQVTRDADIPKAVNTIVEAFRPIIKITPAEYKQMQIIASNAPSILKVNVPTLDLSKPVDTAKAVPVKKDTLPPPPVMIPKTDKLSRAVPAHIRPVFITPATAVTISPVRLPALPAIVFDVPPPPPPVVVTIPATERLTRTTLARNHMLPVELPADIAPDTRRIPDLPALVFEKPAPVVITIPKTDLLTRAILTRQTPYITARAVAIVPSTRPLPALPPLVLDKPAPPPPVVITIPKTDKLTRTALNKQKTYTTARATAIVPNAKPVPSLPPLVFDKPAPPPPPPPAAIMVPKTDKLTRTNLTKQRPYATERATAIIPNAKPVPALPPLVFEKPAPPPPPPPLVITIPKTDKLTRTTPAQRKSLPIDKPEAIAARTKKVPALPALVISIPPPAPVVPVAPPPPPKPAAEKVDRLKPARQVNVNVVFVIEERTYVQRRIPALPPLKIDLPKLPPVKANSLATNVPPAGKKLDYKIETEDAKLTTLEIYFVNGKGQLVSTSPQVVLLDQGTKKEVKKFYRTVDPNGNPDPQENIPVGTYLLTFPAKKNLVIPNVHVEQNKKNKVTVKIKNVSLSFAYLGAPDRPVKEFGARVIERNQAKGRIQDQRCTATFEYEPGNYHIRINTFPEDVRNLDLDLDDESVITILQPGFVKFVSDTKSVVSLWKEDGNKYSMFHQLDLHDPASEHLQIQPGLYQVHYHKGPGGTAASEKVASFVIKSNIETVVELK